MDLSQQQAVLRQLATVPGVVGSVVFDAAGSLGACSFPAVFDSGDLAQLAATLASDSYFQEWLAGDQASLTLRFAQGSVTVKALGASCLLVLCTVQTNEQLLSMSLTQVVRRLKAKGAAPARLPVSPPPAPEPPPPSALERLQAIARAELGAHAAQAIEILSAAGTDSKNLLHAVGDVERMVRLFISKKKSEELAREMRVALDA